MATGSNEIHHDKSDTIIFAVDTSIHLTPAENRQRMANESLFLLTSDCTNHKIFHGYAVKPMDSFYNLRTIHKT